MWRGTVCEEGSQEPDHAQGRSPGYADPDYELSVDWLNARAAIVAAEERHADRSRPRILPINGSSRNEHTCPGEMSKSFRFVEIAKEVIAEDSTIEVEVLDLSRLAAKYGRNIHPCKACYSTAAPLCHWPCSCYPNYSLGQTQDWMNEIYPMWVAAHGVMIVTPVNWYQTSSPIKLMTDRLVCADGGNLDPTSTHGKRCAGSKGAGDERLGLPTPSRRPGVLGDRPRRHRGHGECAARPFRLAAVDASGISRG